VIWGAFIILIVDLLLQTVFRGGMIGLPNRGISFGLGQEMGLIISVFALVIFGVYLYRFRVKPTESAGKPGMTGLWIIFLGGVGNVVCRLIWGSVWDYICLPFLPFCFNLSDVLISLGVVSYILRINGD